jgi:hypothetical protein
LYPNFRGFAPQEHVSAAIAEWLRGVIKRLRSAQSKPFYSVRELAAFFGVAPHTVAVIYGRLEAEGLLVRIRGSQTLLTGRKVQARHPIRGVVGLVIPLPVFLYGLESRAFYIRLEEELRRRHFVADFIFHGMQDETQYNPGLLDRLLAHQLDVVWWFAPDRCLVPVMHQLLDAGIQLVTLSDGKARYPREQYFLDIWQGIADGVAAWREEGIESVTVIGPQSGYGSYEEEIARRILAPSGLKHDVLVLSDAEAARVLQRAPRRRRTGVILFRYYWYARLCDQFPEIMGALFQSSRVMLAQGRLLHGYLWDKPVFADCVTISFDMMARRVARDISSGKVATTKRLVTFRTLYEPRVHLGQRPEHPWEWRV